MAPQKEKTLLDTNDGYNSYLKPPKIGKWEATKLAVYDSKKGTILGRTPRNWGALLIFYLIFYAILAVMFAICMYGLLQSTSKDKPTYELTRSLIGIHPGLGYRPYPQKFEDEGSVIWYQVSNPQNVANWTKSLDVFLDGYTNKSTKGYANRVPCDINKRAPAGKVCDVDVDSFGPCSSKNRYSYDTPSPCIFLKLNRIYNWEPITYSKDNLPTNAPEELVSAINASDHKMIWLSCRGVDDVDKENMGPLKFYPQQGFPSYYYPFTNIEGYVSPLVAVHFQRPTTGILINIECRAWAENIIHEKGRSGEHAAGSVHMELMVDK